MALELAPTVRVNAVAPGYVLTPMQRAEYTDAMLDEDPYDIDCHLGRYVAYDRAWSKLEERARRFRKRLIYLRTDSLLKPPNSIL